MSKVAKHKVNCKCSHADVFLDTLAQLSTEGFSSLNANQLAERESLQKRARAKAFTNSYIFDLIDLESELSKSYWQTYRCSSDILQEGDRATARYCNQRWCLVCNRIRTAKMINGYQEPLSKFIDPQFVTLTIVNVPDKELKSAIESMTNAIKDIRKNLKKTYGLTLRALRKYECTFSRERKDYHPHFHLIVEGLDVSNKLVDLWLKRFPTADRGGQNITAADSSSLNELCKYFTKVIAKDNDYNAKALDVMFQAAKGKRTFQPIGLRKFVSEEIEEIQGQRITIKPPQTEIWCYDRDAYDWVSADGEILSEYSPSIKDLEVINQSYKTKGNVNIETG